MSESKHDTVKNEVELVPTKRTVSAELQLRLKNKKIAHLESIISNYTTREAYRTLQEDEKQLKLNESFNGFGILVQHMDADCYEVIHAQKDLPVTRGARFAKYCLQSLESLTLLPPTAVKVNEQGKWITSPIVLPYAKKYCVNLAAECSAYTTSVSQIQRKVHTTLGQLQHHFRSKIRMHHETAVLYKCYHWVCVATTIFLGFAIVVVACISLVMSDVSIRAVFGLSIVFMCLLLIIVLFLQSQLQYQFKAHNHKLIAHQYRTLLTKVTLEKDHPCESIHHTRLYFRHLVESIVNTHSLFQHSIPLSVTKHLQARNLQRAMRTKKDDIVRSAIEKKTAEIHNIIDQTKNPNMINIRKLNRSFESMIV